MKKMYCTTAILLFALTTMYAQDCNFTPTIEKYRLQGLAKLEIAKSKEDFESVAKDWEMVVDANPNCADMLFNLALIYEKAENFPQAVYYLNQYKEVAGTENAAEEVESLLIKIITKIDARKEQVSRNMEKYAGYWNLRVTSINEREYTDMRGFEIFISPENSLFARVVSVKEFVKISYVKNLDERKNRHDIWGVKNSHYQKYQIVPVKIEDDNIIITYNHSIKAKKRTINKNGKVKKESKLCDDNNGLAEFTLHLVSPSRMEGQWFGNNFNEIITFYFSKEESASRASIGVDTHDVSEIKAKYFGKNKNSNVNFTGNMIQISSRPTISKKNLNTLKNLKTNEGAYVTGFPKISPAKQAGIEEGDVITAVNGVRIVNSCDVYSFIAILNPGDKVKIDVIRGNTNKTFEVTVADRFVVYEEERWEEE